MTKESTYIPPEVWEWDKPSGGAFESINKPTAGSAYEQKLPRGSILCNFILRVHQMVSK